LQEARRGALSSHGDAQDQEDDGEGSDDVIEDDNDSDFVSDHGSEDSVTYFSAEEDTSDRRDPRAKVLSVLELEELFMEAAPDLLSVLSTCFSLYYKLIHLFRPFLDFTDSSGNHPVRLTVGLVGYPNVGKSSTINSLLGEKKVSVSATPGKTKHFQTINLSDKIVLCDCPGLVFPQFATTKADLVCDGVLPIDQLREYTGPTSLVVKRIPQQILESIYGLSIKTRPVDEGGDGQITAENLLIAYASTHHVLDGKTTR